MLQVIAQDRPRLLHRISSCLSQQRCNIEIALIDTEGQMAIDTFYLTSEGKKLPAQLQKKVEKALLDELKSLDMARAAKILFVDSQRHRKSDAVWFQLCACFGRIGLRLDDVQAALSLGRSRPAPRPRVLSRMHGAGAMGAADAGVAAIMQRVVGHVMLVDVLPHLL